MMGIVMIEGVGARLDGLVDVPLDFYHQRMTNSIKEVKRIPSLDPPLRTSYILMLLTRSSLFYG